MERLKIGFEIREEGGTFAIYSTGRDSSGAIVRETLCGRYPAREPAEMALKMTAGMIEKANTPYEPRRITKWRIRTPKESQLQNLILGLDPARLVEFFQEIILMNMTTHMLTDCFDRLDTLFSAYVDKGVRQHYKNAQKQIDKLLEALYSSMFYNSDGADEYTRVVGDSLAWKETLRKVALHCKRRDDDWRWVELVKCVRRIFPDEACDTEDMEVYRTLRKDIVGNDIIDVQNG